MGIWERSDPSLTDVQILSDTSCMFKVFLMSQNSNEESLLDDPGGAGGGWRMKDESLTEPG